MGKYLKLENPAYEFIFENGVLAINIPLTQSRVYSNTRTAHPHFLGMYQQLLDLLFGRCVKIENPFLAKTKGEVVKLLDANGFRDLVKTTISCPNITPLRWKGVKIGKKRHCGICFPCVVRRLSIHYANLWGNDTRYAKNIAADYSKIPKEAKELLFEMMEFSREMDKCSTVDDVFNVFPQFFVEDVDPALLFDMAKRHVAQFKDFLVKRAHQTLRQNLGLP